MNINPDHISIGRIFEQNFLFEVPKYQRYYAWEDEQVNDFINDINNILQNSTPEKPIEHFFGGVVCASKTIKGSIRQQKELIDGQQRITTTILLITNIIAMYKEIMRTRGISPDEEEIIKNRIKKLTDKYIEYQDEIDRKPILVDKLVLSEADRNYFEGVLHCNRVDINRDSHKKIYNANKFLERYVHSSIDECGSITEKIDMLAKIENILHTSCTVIFMDCDSRESAYKLFQVLNDRGAGLNEGDLLKSKTLEALEKFPREQARLQEQWDEVLCEEPRHVELFLRSYYASYYGKRAGRTSLYDDFLKLFFPYLVNDSEEITQNICDDICEKVSDILNEIRVYRKITSGEWPFETVQTITPWDEYRLNLLVKTLSYDITLPLLLVAVQLGAKKFAELTHKLEKFMFRYKTICGNAHQVLSDKYMEEAKKIRDNKENYSLSPLYAYLQSLIDEKANDSTFSVQLQNIKYTATGGNKVIRYFFSVLCDYYRWHSEGENGKPHPNKEHCINFENVTIEHIYSQNPSDNTESPFSQSDQNRIHNLTILSQDDNNNRVKNKPFSEKKVIYNSSNYGINAQLASYDEWNNDSVKSWEGFLVDLACKVFVI